MNIASQRLGILFLAVVAAVLLTACEEALTGVDNTDGVPPIDGNNTPYVEIQTGNDGDVFSDFRSIPGVIPPQALEVGPNVAVEDTLTVDYEVSGPAEEGGDYSVDSPNPLTIPFDTSTTSLESADIVVVRGGGNLTTELTSVDVTLTGVSTTGGTEVLLGRGGQDIGITRTVGIEPSVSVIEDAPSIDTTAVGNTNTGIAMTQNLSVAPFTVQNIEISGPDADEFSLYGIAPNQDSLDNGSFEDPPVDVNPVAIAFIVAAFEPVSEGEKEATLSYDLANGTDTETYEVSLSAVAESALPATNQNARSEDDETTVAPAVKSKIEDNAVLRSPDE